MALVTLVIPTPTTYTLGLDIFYLAIEMSIVAIVDKKKNRVNCLGNKKMFNKKNK